MSNNSFQAGQCIHAMRFIRPAIDCGLIVLGLSLFMHFNTMSSQHSVRENRLQRIESTLKKPEKQVSSQYKPVSIVQQFSSESAMWNAFSLWLHTENTPSGQCRFEIRVDVNNEPYMLQCGASAQTANRRQASDTNRPTLFATDVLVTHEKMTQVTKKRKSKANIIEEQAATTTDKEEEPMRVNGWINTPSGRKVFDATSNRWIP